MDNLNAVLDKIIDTNTNFGDNYTAKKILQAVIDDLKKGCGIEFKPYQSPISYINYDKGICGQMTEDNVFFFCDSCDKKVKELQAAMGRLS